MGRVVCSGYVHHQFRSFEEFQPFMEQNYATWPLLLSQGLRRIAVAGIRDPLTDEPIPPQELEVDHTNFRETISYRGVISRQRAVLLVLRDLIAKGALPDWKVLRLYLTEAITPFAGFMKTHLPRLRCSEYLPMPDHLLRGQVPHRDMRDIGLPPATFHAVICNEVLEHVEELIPSLKGIAEILSFGGHLIATVPFLYGQYDHEVKAIWRPELGHPEVIGEPDYHGNPVNSEGSLVYRYPGWKILDDLREAGFSDVSLHLISSTRYGVIGAESPNISVLVAKR